MASTGSSTIVLFTEPAWNSPPMQTLFPHHSARSGYPARCISSGEIVVRPSTGQLLYQPSCRTPSMRRAKKSPCRVRRIGRSLMTTHPLGISHGSRLITVLRSFNRMTLSVKALGENAGPAKLRGLGGRKFSFVSMAAALSDKPCWRITRICSINACWSCFTWAIDSSLPISHWTPTRKGCWFRRTRPTANMFRKVFPWLFVPSALSSTLQWLLNHRIPLEPRVL